MGVKMRNLDVFLIFIAVRLLSILLVQTWYVPDEYWQSLEVAHRMTFGYGHLTWEWALGIRSYFHPLVIAFFYKALQLISFDCAELLVRFLLCYSFVIIRIYSLTLLIQTFSLDLSAESPSSLVERLRRSLLLPMVRDEKVGRILHSQLLVLVLYRLADDNQQLRSRPYHHSPLKIPLAGQRRKK